MKSIHMNDPFGSINKQNTSRIGRSKDELNKRSMGWECRWNESESSAKGRVIKRERKEYVRTKRKQRN